MVKKAAHKQAKKRIARPVISGRQVKLLEGAMAGGFAFVIGSVFLISSLQNFFMATNQFASVIDSVLVDLTNTDRVAYNLGTLTVNEKLVAAAQAKANDMAAKSYFSHTSPEGLDSWHWFKQSGYDFKSAGENLAVDFSDSADVERAWMNSPTHRDNILNGKYTEVGIATASGMYNGHSTVFVVTMFGTPRVGATTPAPQNPEFEAVPSDPNKIATAQNPSTVLGENTETQPVTPAVLPNTNVPEAETPVAAPQREVKLPQAAALAPVPTEQAPIGAIVRESNDWQVLATSPSTTLKYSYYLLALLVLLALAVDTGLEIRWHHRKRAATAGFMLAAMAGLFWYADYSMFRHATVANSGATLTRSL